MDGSSCSRYIPLHHNSRGTANREGLLVVRVQEEVVGSSSRGLLVPYPLSFFFTTYNVSFHRTFF